MDKRIYGKKSDLDRSAIKAFFESRVQKYDPEKPLVSMLYQDSNPDMAQERDREEKRRVLPLLAVTQEDRVLDIGCGIGRWGDLLAEKVGHYHGTDFSAALIDIAHQRLEARKTATFQAIAAQDITPERLEEKPPYNLIIIAGVLIYMNDEDCLSALRAAAACCGPHARVYIREPLAVDERLTLDRIWSEELNHEYSAIYRTHDELMDMIETVFLNDGFSIKNDEPLYPPALNNRKETRQHMLILSRE
jgi:cyclopropane fatty-acyl-phospholipid synthase-like methyltransferase